MVEQLPTCGDCGAAMELSKGRFGWFLRCERFPRCRGTHAVHQDTLEPTGTPADAETRRWRRIAHDSFDRLWIDGHMARPDAYEMLAEKLGIDVDDAHIGSFDLARCKRVLDIVDAYFNETEEASSWE